MHVSKLQNICICSNMIAKQVNNIRKSTSFTKNAEGFDQTYDSH